MRAWLNPVRHWMVDRFDVREAGDDKDFAGITGTWTGVVSAATLLRVTDQASYNPGHVYSNSTCTFSRGSEVYLLDAPDGEVFVMQSFTRHWAPGLSESDLAHLYRWLDLPDRWGFRAALRDEDLEVTANPDNLAHVLQDNLHNVYLGSDVGRAFSQLTPQDSLW